MERLQDWRVLFPVFVAVAVGCGVDKWLKTSAQGPRTHYNNYVIFSNAAKHLADGTDLYIPHPTEHHDLYLYSPTAAVAFTPTQWVPDIVGIVIWESINALALIGAIAYLPRQKWLFALIGWYILKESVTGFQHNQSNGLTTGLMVLTLACLERKQTAAAALVTVMSLYLKIFGFAAAALWLVFPNKGKFVAWSGLWFVALGAAPLLVTSPESLLAQYQSWFRMHQEIHSDFYGYGLPGMLHAWFGITSGRTVLTLVGAGLVCLPALLRAQGDQTGFRQTMLGALMLWANVFNHKLEPATCIVGVTGVALWLTARPITRGRVVAAVCVYIFTCWGNSDLVPQWMQDNVLEPLFQKTLPLLVVWSLATFELWTVDYRRDNLELNEKEPVENDELFANSIRQAA